jgi:hypothetical protein
MGKSGGHVMLSFGAGKSAEEVTHVAMGISVVIHSSCLLFLFPFGPVLRNPTINIESFFRHRICVVMHVIH